MSRYFQPRWAYLSRSVSTTSYFGDARQVSLCGRRGHSPGSRPAAPRAGDSRPGPRGGAGQAGGGVGGVGIPSQMGGEASWKLCAPTPGAPLNLCPESVTSRYGSLPGAKNSSFSFESFLVSGPSGSPHLEPSHREKIGRAAADGWKSRAPCLPPSPSRLGARPAARLGGGEQV